MERLVAAFKALGEPTRLKILKLVVAEELCVCELVELLQMSQSAVSQHLARLRNVGLVRERRQGSWVYYSADQEQLAEVSEQLAGFFGRELAEIPEMADIYERRLFLVRAEC